MTRSLVTGGAGFIGSHLAAALCDRGDEVLIADDLSTGKRSNVELLLDSGRARLVEVDVSVPGALEAAIRDWVPERIFHIAGQVDVRKAVADPVFDARVNIVGSIEVLEAARRANCPVVFTSTGGASYGEGTGRKLPFGEGDRTIPETAYGVSKLAAEAYVAYYRLLFGVPGLSLRLGNVYGPRQDPHGEAGVVAIFCGRLLAGEAPIVFGDGKQTRDYIYVGDVVSGIIAAEQGLTSGRAAENVYNIGTGTETSVLEIAEALGAIAGVSLVPDLRPPRKGEVQRVAISPGAARRDFGWTADTSLHNGLAETFAWARATADAGA